MPVAIPIIAAVVGAVGGIVSAKAQAKSQEKTAKKSLQAQRESIARQEQLQVTAELRREEALADVDRKEQQLEVADSTRQRRRRVLLSRGPVRSTILTSPLGIQDEEGAQAPRVRTLLGT